MIHCYWSFGGVFTRYPALWKLLEGRTSERFSSPAVFILCVSVSGKEPLPDTFKRVRHQIHWKNQKLKVCFNILNNLSIISPNVFTLHPRPSPRHPHNQIIFKPYVKTLAHRHSFFVSVIPIWNSLPLNVALAHLLLNYPCQNYSNKLKFFFPFFFFSLKYTCTCTFTFWLWTDFIISFI